MARDDGRVEVKKSKEPLTKEQHDRLKQSIQHWRRMRQATLATLRLRDEKPGPDDCSCCVAWLDVGGCKGCPIAQTTGRQECRGTPYTAAYQAWSGVVHGRHPLRVFRDAAKDMIDFMEQIIKDRGVFLS